MALFSVDFSTSAGEMVMMMAKTHRTIIAVSASLLVLTGCLRSIHPLYTSNDTVFREELLGSWLWLYADHCAIYVNIESIADRAYRITEFGGEDGDTIYMGHLLELDGILYFDFQLLIDEEDPLKNGVLPFHQITRIRFEENHIIAEILDESWLEEYLEQHPDELDFTRANGRLLITAETEELQQFFIAHADDWPISFEQQWQRGTFPRDRIEGNQ